MRCVFLGPIETSFGPPCQISTDTHFIVYTRLLVPVDGVSFEPSHIKIKQSNVFHYSTWTVDVLDY